jgi:hypothetical protein
MFAIIHRNDSMFFVWIECKERLLWRKFNYNNLFVLKRKTVFESEWHKRLEDCSKCWLLDSTVVIYFRWIVGGLGNIHEPVIKVYGCLNPLKSSVKISVIDSVIVKPVLRRLECIDFMIDRNQLHCTVI